MHTAPQVRIQDYPLMSSTVYYIEADFHCKAFFASLVEQNMFFNGRYNTMAFC